MEKGAIKIQQENTFDVQWKYQQQYETMLDEASTLNNGIEWNKPGEVVWNIA